MILNDGRTSLRKIFFEMTLNYSPSDINRSAVQHDGPNILENQHRSYQMKDILYGERISVRLTTDDRLRILRWAAHRNTSMTEVMRRLIADAAPEEAGKR